jgi:hypothetical protein
MERRHHWLGSRFSKELAANTELPASAHSPRFYLEILLSKADFYKQIQSASPLARYPDLVVLRLVSIG